MITLNNIKPRIQINEREEEESSSLSSIPKITSTADLISDSIRENNLKIVQSSKIYDPTWYRSYSKYGVFPERYETQEQLDKARAENQTAGEKLRRFAGQLVVNEVILGTLDGLAAIPDALRHIFTDNDDYQNAISAKLNQAQDYLRKQWEIYEKPHSEYQIMGGGLGGVLNGAVSIGSTLSLLIPGLGYAKGLSMLGKVSRLNRLGYKTVKWANKATKGKVFSSPMRQGKAIGQGLETAKTAFLNRTAEGYIEAREVYKQNYDYVTNRLAEMTPEEREELYKRNPTFVDKSDKEIAEFIAGDSADKTFNRDYWMIFFDIVQLKSIGALWRGMPSKRISWKLAQTQQRELDNLGKSIVTKGLTNEAREKAINETIDAVTKDMTKWKKLGQNIKYNWKSYASQLTEGIEEGYQGIMSQLSNQNAQLYLDPDIDIKTLDDYLTDPEIIEQAIWGVIGGVLFQAAGTGLGNLSNKIKADVDYKRSGLSKEDWEKNRLTDLKRRQVEIIGRSASLQNLTEKMDKVNNGLNPYKPINIEGTPIVDDKGNIQYETLEKDDVEYVKDRIINDYVDELTIKAIDAGNYEMLYDYFTNKLFTAKLAENKIDMSDKQWTDYISSRMRHVGEIYTQAIYDVNSNISSVNKNDLFKPAIARSITEANLSIEHYNEEINKLKENLNSDSSISDVRVIADDYFKMLYALNEYNDLINIIKNINNQKDTPNNVKRLMRDKIQTNLNAIRDYINTFSDKYNLPSHTNDDLNHLIDNANDYINEITENIELIKNQYNSTTDNKFYLGNISNSARETLNYITTFEIEKRIKENSIPKTKKEFQETLDRLKKDVENSSKKRIENANKIIEDYINNETDPTEALNNIISGNVPENVQNALEVIKFGVKSPVKDLQDKVNNVIKERERKEQEKNNFTNNGESVSREEGERLRQETERPNVNTTNPSTGGRTESTTAETSTQSTTTDTSAQVNTKQEVKEIVSEETNDSQPVEGEETITPKVNPNIASDEFGQIVEVTDEQLVEDEAKITALEEKVIRDEAMTFSEEVRDVNANAIGEATNIFYKIVGKYHDTLQNALDDNFFNSNLFTNLVQQIASELRQNGVNSDRCIEAAVIGIKSGLKWIKNRFNNPNTIDGLLASINIQSVLERIKEERIQFSSIDGLQDFKEQDSFNKMVEDFLYKYVTEVLHRKTYKNKKSTIVVSQLFDYIINNDSISYFDAVNLFKGIGNYIIQYGSSKSDKFRFIGTKLMIANLNNPVSYFNQLAQQRSPIIERENQFHINISSDGKGKASKDVLEYVEKNVKPGDKLTIRKDINLKGKELPLIISHNGVDIGYLPLISFNGSNGYKKLNIKNGLDITVYNQDGSIKSNLDELFNELIEDFDIDEIDSDTPINLIFRQVVNGEELNDDELKIVEDYILQNKYKDLIKHEDIKITDIIDRLGNIIFYDKFNFDKNIIINNYTNYIEKVYFNYFQQHNLQEILNDDNSDKSIELIFENIPSKIQSLNRENETNIKDVYRKKDNLKMFIINKDEDIIDENGNITAKNKNLSLGVGHMGYIIGEDLRGNPILSIFTSENKIDGDIKNAIETEFINLFDNYQNGKISFNDLYSKLNSLLVGPGTNSAKLFSGISVFKSDDVITFIDNKNGNKHLFNIYNNDNTRKSNDVVNINFAIYNDKGKKIYFSDLKKKGLQTFAKNLSNHLFYNRSFYTFEHQESNYKNNDYVYKENNQLVINIGGKEFKYNSYSDFVMKNNAFKTRQKYNENTGYFEIPEYSKSFNVTFQIREKQTNPILNREESITERLQSSGDEGMSTFELLTLFGYSKDDINVLTGQTEDLNGISLIPDRIYYDAKKGVKFAYTTKGKVYIKEKGLNSMLKHNIKYGSARILMHEQFHNLLSQYNKKNGRLSRQLVNELLETYRQFKESVRAQLENYPNDKQLQELNKFINDLDNVFNNDKVSDARKAEEWLVESLTQTPLIEYLNNTNYIGTIEETKKEKTIWQKIIDCLLKLFGINNGKLKDGSILAKHYSLLGNSIHANNSKQTNIEYTVNEDITESATEESNENVSNQEQENVEDINNINNENNPSNNINDQTEENKETEELSEEDKLNKLLEGIEISETSIDEVNEDIAVGDDNIENDNIMFSSVEQVEDVVSNNLDILYNNRKINTIGYISLQDMGNVRKEFPNEANFLEDKIENNESTYICR